MSKKLLLADDSVVIQKLVGLSFANENIEIISTDNGDDAVTMARDLRPDVILADVVMPGLSGYEVCEAIKQDAGLAHTPVLLLTGTFEAFDEARAAAVGANGQITKPFEAQALVERVKAVMNALVEVAVPAASVGAEQTIVAPIGHDLSASIPGAIEDVTSSSNDLFDSGITPLADDLSFGDETPLDVTPSVAVGIDDVNEETASEFFGPPGDGANDLLDTQGSSIVLGQSMSAANAEASSTSGAPLSGAPLSGAPLSGAPLTNPLSESSLNVTPDSAADGDPLASLGSSLLAPSPIPPATAVDLDSALDAGGLDGDATILVANDDINATTSSNLHDLLADPFAATGSFDDLTFHAPLADIDQDFETANSPVFNDSGSHAGVSALDALGDLAADATIVANLDEAFAEPPRIDAAPADAGFAHAQYPSADPFTPSAIAASESTIVETDPLGLAPTHTASDEVDFAFEVSAPASVSSASLEDSFSSLMDISESQILSAAPADPTPTGHDAPDPIGAGYDVSSSELATAPETNLTQAEDTIAGADGSLAATPIPELEALVEVPELPQSYSPPQPAAPQNAAADDSIMGSASLFDDLTTGSPLDELDVPNAFASAGDLDIDHDLLNDDLSVGLSAYREGAEAFEVDLEQAETYSTNELAAAPELIHAVSDDEFAIGSDFGAETGAIDGLGGQAGPEAREHSVPDLTPMMEQRIQETLEKVAWEAFSDLSESIVKQVMGRVEQIAWEVIPEMAETLVREEIRKMKGDDE
jgi:CheY-like chemotaxis protein